MPEPAQVTLGEELRSLAQARILRAARSVLVSRGLDSTVDDVASAAGVSRRTVFRHFSTHGQLLAAAAGEILDDYEALPVAPPEDADVDEWLVEIAIAFHTFHADLVGQAFWDIYAGRQSMPAELAAVLDVRLAKRFETASTIARHGWRAIGAEGSPPAWLEDVFVVELSSFAHHARIVGRDRRSPAETGRASANVLSRILRSAARDD